MIKIIAKNYVKPESKAAFVGLAMELVSESRKEEGCISYSLFQDLKNTNEYVFVEEWKDQKAIDDHNSTIHFTTIVPQLHNLCEKNGEVSLYSEVRGE